MSSVPAVEVGSSPGTSASRCPVDHAAPAEASATGACPVQHDAIPVQRSRADLVVRKVLRIKERPPGVSAASAYATFQRSMLISATRCTLTYVIFPFVLPAIGIVSGVGPILGVVIGVIAMTCDVFTIRRFFQVDHRWRWQVSAIAVCVIGLLTVLLVEDVAHLVTNGPFG
ncbi:hypothetical protein [Dermatobacter hominis]|uniref:hypothetical protein n=1 Tax=Dermatobacter hominis TaxID=2884263 RepID=UPI001D0FF97B|nr:hypothetical protein [Dermatobacter hominis]UDY37563.1 hypothetical protein LH044_08480 [Dermatobacter hominis]